MALYRITVSRTVTSNGVRLEKGMSVDVVTTITTNPVSVNNGTSVKDAFKRIYGVDLSPLGTWTAVRGALSVEKVG